MKESCAEKIRLILIRHGSRDTSDRQLDNGLDEKGHDQAQEFSKFLKKKFSDKKIRFISSARNRCRETIEPAAKAFRQSVQIEPLALEQEDHESNKIFLARIRTWIEAQRQELPQSDDLVVLCSHGDWIPVATDMMVSTSINLKKGGFILWGLETQNQAPSWKMMDVIQKL